MYSDIENLFFFCTLTACIGFVCISVVIHACRDALLLYIGGHAKFVLNHT